MSCEAKHTKYQPTGEEFRCPRCRAESGDFYIDDGPNVECELLHDEDRLVCLGKDSGGCPSEYETSGRAFAAALVKKKNLVPCSHCKGTGYEKGKA
jgi:hypothetical protein